MERAIQYEIALINQDHNLLQWVVDNLVDRLRHNTVFQGGHHHDVTTINNKIAFCEHNAGVFHYIVLQLLKNLLHIKMCFSALRHSLWYFLIKSKYVCLILERKSTVLVKVQLSAALDIVNQTGEESQWLQEHIPAHQDAAVAQTVWCCMFLLQWQNSTFNICWKPTKVDAQCDGKKTEHWQMSVATNKQSSGQPFKTSVFCKEHGALHSGSQGLWKPTYYISPLFSLSHT